MTNPSLDDVRSAIKCYEECPADGVKVSLKNLEVFYNLAQSYLDASGELPEERKIDFSHRLDRGGKVVSYDKGFNSALSLCRLAYLKQAKRVEQLTKSICPDGSITDIDELIDFAKDLQHAYTQLSKIDELQAKHDYEEGRRIEYAKDNSRLHKEIVLVLKRRDKLEKQITQIQSQVKAIPSVDTIQEVLMQYIPYKKHETQVAQAIHKLIQDKGEVG
jgi:hypothetical protein